MTTTFLCIPEIVLAEMLLLFLTEGILTKPGKLPQRGENSTQWRDPMPCGNNTPPGCARWLPPAPPHTPTCSPRWNLQKQCSLQSTRSCPGFTILHHQPIFIHSVKSRKASNFFISKNDWVLRTPLYENTERVREWEAQCRERMERRRREERRGDHKCAPYQNFCLRPRAAVLWPNRPVKVSGEDRSEREREHWGWWGSCWVRSALLYVLPPILSLAANFLNEP